MSSIVLASASPRRRRLLQQIGLSFEVRPASVDERWSGDGGAKQMVTDLALRKARAMAAALDGGLVIGADTVVLHRGRVLEKPAGPEEARRMLHRLGGESHEVFTGVAFVLAGPTQNNTPPCTFAERTTVTFGEIDNEIIRKYVDSGAPMDKAGAYGIQDPMGALLVKNICGDYHNVVGFPLHAFYRRLQSFAPEYLELQP